NSLHIIELPAQFVVGQAGIQRDEDGSQACQGVDQDDIGQSIGRQERYAALLTDTQGSQLSGQLRYLPSQFSKAPLPWAALDGDMLWAVRAGAGEPVR